MAYKILNTIGEAYTQEARPILEALGTVDYLSLTQETLLDCVETYDIAIVGLGLQFNAEVLARAKNLKAIGTATTGLDHIDVDKAQAQGIAVLSLKEERDFLNTITGTAELAFGLMLDIMRRISPAYLSVKNGAWDRDAFRGFEAKGKTLGIVGFGRLGSMMAKYGNGFGMRVLAHDPAVSDDNIIAAGATPVSWDEVISTSDVVSIHVHLSPETEGLFNADIFTQMQSHAYLINTSRGKIVNEADLIAALDNGDIAGYATDVLDGELAFRGVCEDHPLVQYMQKHNNVIIVPHIGGMVHESRIATDVFIAEKVARFFE